MRVISATAFLEENDESEPDAKTERVMHGHMRVVDEAGVVRKAASLDHRYGSGIRGTLQEMLAL